MEMGAIGCLFEQMKRGKESARCQLRFNGTPPTKYGREWREMEGTIQMPILTNRHCGRMEVDWRPRFLASHN